jgi:glycosyltransferase involved in cell wall biosynthesis
MRVLSIVTNRYASFYRNQTKALEKLGVDIHHACPPKQSSDHGVRQEISRTSLDYAILYANVLKQSLKGFDLVHANYGLTAPHALGQFQRPVVLSLWGSDLKGRIGFLSKQCSKLVDEVIVMSKEMENELDQEANVIPHGIDMSIFRPMSQQKAQESINWSLGTKHVIFPYDPSRDVKNYPLAERVTKAVNRKLPSNIKLHVIFGVDHSSIPVYMNAADALLLTSFREGSPNTVKEALACGLPIIATDVGDVRKQLTGVDPSRVCTSESELARALAEVLERGERSDGREHVQHLSIERMGNRIIDVYENVLGNTEP